MDWNKLKDQGVTYLQKGKEVAVDVTEKGKVEVLILNNQTKLYRAERQLGALVYRFAKGRAEHQADLVDTHVEAIAAIEQEIARLKASIAPAAQQEAEAAQQVDVAQEVAEAEEVEAEEAAAAEAAEAAEEVEVVEPRTVTEPEVPVQEKTEE